MEELSGIIIIFLIIVAVLAFLMPFFIFRIRNELISMNQKMSEIVKLLGGEKANDYEKLDTYYVPPHKRKR